MKKEKSPGRQWWGLRDIGRRKCCLFLLLLLVGVMVVGGVEMGVVIVG